MGVSRRRATPLVLALLGALLCVAVAAAMPARDPAGHPPMAASGPDGRRALDGPWTLRVAGEERRRVRLPSSPNARHVTGAAGVRSFAGNVAWFETVVHVARGGDHAIRFESVHHRARVWVDGRQVARHTGAYLPFEARAAPRRGRARTSSCAPTGARPRR